MNDDTFDFILLCNKICGASHYNMQMPLMVTAAAEYDTWMTEADEKTVPGSCRAPARHPPPPPSG